MNSIEYSKTVASTFPEKIMLAMTAGVIASCPVSDVGRINPYSLFPKPYVQHQNSSTFDYATNPFAGIFYQENNPFEGFGDYSFSGWDGEDAVPIREKVLTDAKSLISNLPKKFRYPDAAPGIDGSVCMEWLIGEKEIFIDFNSDGSVLIYADINGKKYKNGFSRFDNGALEYILSIFQEA